MSDKYVLPLRSKIAAGLATSLLVLVVGAISYWAVSRATKSFEAVNHTGKVLLEQRKLLAGLSDAETSARGFALTGEDKFLRPFDAANVFVPASIRKLRALTADNPDQQARLDTLESVAGEQLRLNDQIIRFRKQQGFEIASDIIRSGQGQMVMDHARALMAAMEAEENEILSVRAANQERDQRIAYLVIAIGGGLAFLLSLLINRSIRRDVIDREQQREMIERQTRELKRQADELGVQQAEQARLARQMTALLESTEAGFYGIDTSGCCTFVNRAGAAMLGYSVEELAGKHMHDVAHYKHADGRPYPESECPIYLSSSGGNTSGEADDEVFWRKDGTSVAVEYSTAPIVESGEVRGAVVAFADITDRKRAQRAIAESEERKAAVLRTTLDSIITMDAAGVVTEFNPAAETTFGFTREEAKGKLLGDLIVPERLRAAHFAGLERYLASGEAHILGKRLELPARRKDGTEFQSELTITRSDIDGKPAFTGVLRDITLRKQQEGERDQLMKALAKSNQELDQFAYVASHDLKAPLRGIANLSSWIEEDLGETLHGESKDQMEMLRGRVHRMEALIDGILHYSRAARAKARPEEIDTGLLVGEILDLIAPPQATKIVIQEGMPVVRAEKVPLQQVFMNLIGNAIKHARAENPRIEISWASMDPFVQFSVTDNGQGIAPQYHERIFGIFQTLEARDKVEGTGIGLSVVQKIVEAKGGRVWVESDIGKGAKFSFLWPLVETTGA